MGIGMGYGLNDVDAPNGVAFIETRVVYRADEAYDADGRTRSTRLFLNSGAADAFAKAHAFMGSNGVPKTFTAQVVTVNGQAYLLGERVFSELSEYKASEREEIRQRALAKLTKDERAALEVK